MKRYYRLYLLPVLVLSFSFLNTQVFAQMVTGEVTGVDAIRKVLYLRYPASQGRSDRFAWASHVPGRERLERASIGDELTIEVELAGDTWQVVSVAAGTVKTSDPVASVGSRRLNPATVDVSVAAIAEAAAPRDLTDDSFSEQGTEEGMILSAKPEPVVVPTFPDAAPETVEDASLEMAREAAPITTRTSPSVRKVEPVRVRSVSRAEDRETVHPIKIKPELVLERPSRPAPRAVAPPLRRELATEAEPARPTAVKWEPARPVTEPVSLEESARPDALRTREGVASDMWHSRPLRERAKKTDDSSMPYYHRAASRTATPAPRTSKTNFMPSKERPAPPRARRPQRDGEASTPFLSFMADSINGAARSIESAFER